MGSGFAGFLMNLVGPLAKRVLTALGFGFVTYVGIDAALNAALDAARSNLAGLPGDAVALMSLGGFSTAIGIVTGAIVARVSIQQLKKLIPQ